MKHIITTLFCLILSCLTFCVYSYDYSETIPYDEIEGSTETITEMNEMMQEDIADPSKETFFGQLLRIMWIDKYFEEWFQDNPTIEKNATGRFIVRLINYGIMSLGLITMLFLIYGFFMMFFSKDDEWFSKAKKIVRNSFIAIAVIALSRFVTTFIIYIYHQVKQDPNTIDDENTSHQEHQLPTQRG